MPVSCVSACVLCDCVLCERVCACVLYVSAYVSGSVCACELRECVCECVCL